MTAWLLLGVAIIAEVIATSALKASAGFTRVGPAICVIVGYGVAFYCLALVLKSLPVGVAYAIWSGLGIVLITVIGVVFFDQWLSPLALLGIALIAVGVVLVSLVS